MAEAESRAATGHGSRSSERVRAFSSRHAAFLLVVVLGAAVGLAVSAYPVAILLALGLVALALGVSRSLRNPEALVIVLIAYLSVNDIVSQLLASSGTATILVGSVKDITLGLLLVSIVLGRQRRVRIPVSTTLLVLICLSFGVLSARLSTNPGQALYGFRNDFEPLLVLCAAISLAPAISWSRLTEVSAAVGQAVAVVAIGTNLLLGLNWLNQLGLTEGGLPSAYFVAGSIQPRAFSPLVAPNELGVFSVVLLALTLAAPWSFRQRSLLAAAPVAAIWLSQSRSALAGLVLMLALSVVLTRARAKRWRPAAQLLSLGGLVLLVALYVVLRLDTVIFRIADPSTLGHLASLTESVGLAVAHPLGLGLGTVGPRALRFTSTPVFTESYVLLLTLEAGIPVLLGYVALLAGIAVGLARKLGDPSRGSAALAGLLALAGTVVNQLVLPTMQDGAVSWILWLVVGIALGKCIDMQGEVTQKIRSGPQITGATGQQSRARQRVASRGPC